MQLVFSSLFIYVYVISGKEQQEVELIDNFISLIIWQAKHQITYSNCKIYLCYCIPPISYLVPKLQCCFAQYQMVLHSIFCQTANNTHIIIFDLPYIQTGLAGQYSMGDLKLKGLPSCVCCQFKCISLYIFPVFIYDIQQACFQPFLSLVGLLTFSSISRLSISFVSMFPGICLI